MSWFKKSHRQPSDQRPGYDEFMRTCAGCQKSIDTTRELYLIRLEEVWHEYCFRCGACDRPIEGCRFVVSQDNAYHNRCHERRSHQPEPSIAADEETASSGSKSPTRGSEQESAGKEEEDDTN